MTIISLREQITTLKEQLQSALNRDITFKKNSEVLFKAYKQIVKSPYQRKVSYKHICKVVARAAMKTLDTKKK